MPPSIQKLLVNRLIFKFLESRLLEISFPLLCLSSQRRVHYRSWFISELTSYHRKGSERLAKANRRICPLLNEISLFNLRRIGYPRNLCQLEILLWGFLLRYGWLLGCGAQWSLDEQAIQVRGETHSRISDAPGHMELFVASEQSLQNKEFRIYNIPW